MGKRRCDIKMVLHTPTDSPAIFCDNQIDEFWIGKMTERMQKYFSTDIDKNILIQNLKNAGQDYLVEGDFKLKISML